MKTTYNAKRLINHPTAFDFSAGVFLLKALYEARTEGRNVTIVTAAILLMHFWRTFPALTQLRYCLIQILTRQNILK